VVLLIYLFICAVLTSTAYAEDSWEKNEAKLAYLNLGTGVSNFGFCVGASMTQDIGFGFLTGKVDFSSQFIDHAYELGLLYGIAARSKFGYASIASGISRTVIDQTESGLVFISEVKRSIDHTWGQVIDIQLTITPLSFVGLGLNYFVNFNPVENYHGIMICFLAGKFR